MRQPLTEWFKNLIAAREERLRKKKKTREAWKNSFTKTLLAGSDLTDNEKLHDKEVEEERIERRTTSESQRFIAEQQRRKKLTRAALPRCVGCGDRPVSQGKSKTACYARRAGLCLGCYRAGR